MGNYLSSLLLIVALAGFLPGCGNLIELPGSGSPPQIYSLNPPIDFGVESKKRDWRLAIEEPYASLALDSDRIAMKPSPVEIKYYSRAKWTDRAPRLVQNLIIETFDNTETLEFVGRGISALSAQYLLRGSLTAFEVDYDGGSPVVRVKLKLSLVDQRSNEILASRVFESTVDASRNQIRSIVLAFDEAMGHVLTDVVSWTLSQVDEDEEPPSVSLK